LLKSSERVDWQATKWQWTSKTGIVILNQLLIVMNLGIDVVSLEAATNIVLLSFLQPLVTIQQACHAA